MRKWDFCFNNQEARLKRMRYRFGAQKLNLRRLQPERQRQRIMNFYFINRTIIYQNCAPTTSRAATDMANNEPIIHPPKHKQTKTRTAETDHKQPPSTATSRLLLPEERQPRAILKTRARPLQPGAPETQVHSPNQGYLHPHPHPVSHRRQRPAPLG